MEEIKEVTVKLEAVKKPHRSITPASGIPADEIDTQLVEDVEAPSPLPVSVSLPEPATRSIVRLQEPEIPIKAKSRRDREATNAAALQERCRQICLSLFFREDTPVRSLGFTSAIDGEGKSFLATVMANILAQDVSSPITLLECNWEHPVFHEQFGVSPTPGVAEWLRGECTKAEIRHHVEPNLTIIPAGNGRHEGVKFIEQIKKKGLLPLFTTSANELLVVDLPAIVTCAYGSLLASLVESLIIVVRAGQTTDRMFAQTCKQLKNLPVEGVILNQVESKIPRWLRQLL